MIRFTDRREAGRLLAEQLSDYRNCENVVVAPVHLLAEEVAEEVARQLRVRYVDAVESLPALSGSIVLMVDDGFDSIERVFEAGLIARDHGAAVVVSAAPVGDRDVCHKLTVLMDRSLCLTMPAPFHRSSFWYEDSLQVSAALLFSTPPATIPRRRPQSRRKHAVR